MKALPDEIKVIAEYIIDQAIEWRHEVSADDNSKSKETIFFTEVNQRPVEVCVDMSAVYRVIEDSGDRINPPSAYVYLLSITVIDVWYDGDYADMSEVNMIQDEVNKLIDPTDLL